MDALGCTPMRVETAVPVSAVELLGADSHASQLSRRRRMTSRRSPAPRRTAGEAVAASCTPWGVHLPLMAPAAPVSAMEPSGADSHASQLSRLRRMTSARSPASLRMMCGAVASVGMHSGSKATDASPSSVHPAASVSETRLASMIVAGNSTRNGPAARARLGLGKLLKQFLGDNTELFPKTSSRCDSAALLAAVVCCTCSCGSPAWVTNSQSWAPCGSGSASNRQRASQRLRRHARHRRITTTKASRSAQTAPKNTHATTSPGASGWSAAELAAAAVPHNSIMSSIWPAR
mmetsp:Transcript_55353/g.177525  ORF Transcript_55353/g.177525 Transcript_55353/m.177525 type:complete len:291 (-) Transcript_55353:679-1551(-)